MFSPSKYFVTSVSRRVAGIALDDVGDPLGYFASAYDEYGAREWLARMEVDGEVYPEAVAIDECGAIYLACSFILDDDIDFLAVRLNESSGEAVWSRAHDWSEDDVPHEVSIDLRGNVVLSGLTRGAGGRFMLGDANADGHTDISDALSILNYLFLGHAMPCLASGDIDSSGRVSGNDALLLFQELFILRFGYVDLSQECEELGVEGDVSCDDYSPCM